MQIAILGFVGLIVLIFLLIFLGAIPGLKTPPPAAISKVPLTFWGIKGDESAWANVINSFQANNPNVSVSYITIDESAYENVLLDSLAAGAGPDIFLIHNDWLSRYKNKILPAPEAILNQNRISEIFPRVVYENFVSDNGVFAAPISINTLALAYNRDIFDAKQVSIVPDGWADIKSIIPKLRQLKNGRIEKEAISLGGSSVSVVNAPDLLTLFMLQFEAAKSSASLLDALKFYIDFSDPKSKNYTLDDSFENSFGAYANGNSAMVFLYPADIQKIRAKNPLMSSSIRLLPMPQIDRDRPANLTSFWGLSVSNKTSDYNLAWDFINFATTNQSSVNSYALISGNSPALRSSINDFKDHPTLKIFAPQILNAKTYPSFDEKKARLIFDDMIKSALKDRSRISTIAKDALTKISQLR